MLINTAALVALLLFGVVLAAVWLTVHYFLRRAFTPRVFISYRRADTGPTADHLWADLAGRFGPENVFFDRVGIQTGNRYPDVLAGQLGLSTVVVALIGPQWAGDDPAGGAPRVLDDFDWVRHEVETAVAQGKLRVALVSGPGPTDVGAVPVYPPSRLGAWGRTAQNRLLEEVSRNQAIPLPSGGAGYVRQRDELIRVLERVRLGRLRPVMAASRWLGLLLIWAAVGLAGVAAAAERARVDAALAKANGRVDAVEARVTATEGRVGTLEGDVGQLQSLDRATRERSATLEKEVEKLKPVAYLPLEFEQFINAVSKLPVDKAAKAYSGKFVVWKATCEVPNDSKLGSVVAMKLTPFKPPAYQLIARADKRDVPDAADFKPGDPVIVTGMIRVVRPGAVELGDARFFPGVP